MSAVKPPQVRVIKLFRCLATALPFLMVALGLLAVRPDWHAALHDQSADRAHHDHGQVPDSDARESGCAIEMFASGLLDSAVFVAAVDRPTAVFPIRLLIPSERPLAALSRPEPPGRAPPFTS